MNGYSYVNGNPVNLVDRTGMYACNSETATLQTACAEMDQALRRASGKGLVYGSISNTVQDGMIQLGNLETAAEQTFGAQLAIRLPDQYLNQEGLVFDECSTVTNENVGSRNVELTKQSVLRTVAAMIHIAAKFEETLVPASAMYTWLSGERVEFLSDTVGITGPYTGYTQLEPPNNIINLGSLVYVGTIVHELGHSFDRKYQERASFPLRRLYLLRDSGSPTYDVNADGYPNPTQNEHGMLTRATDDREQEEIWADMFMTWILDGQGIEAFLGSGIVGWDEEWPRDARFKEIYTWLTVRRLSIGVGGPPPANATMEENLAWVRIVSNLAFGYPGDPNNPSDPDEVY